jgi:hypothetical protein
MNEEQSTPRVFGSPEIQIGIALRRFLQTRDDLRRLGVPEAAIREAVRQMRDEAD